MAGFLRLTPIAAVLAAAVTMLVATGASAAPPKRAVDVSTAVSGRTLTVELRAAVGATCSVQVGSGERATKLPKTKIAAGGRGTATWDIPSSAAGGRRAVTAACSRGGKTLTGRTFAVLPAAAVSDDGDNNALATVLNVLLDILLGGSLVLFVWLLIDMVVRETDPAERLLRSLALIGGAVIALGAEAAGVSFADYTIDSLTGARPGGEAFKALSVIVPGGIAAAFGWYFVRVMRRSAAMGLRLLSFLGMLTIVSFAVIFAQATNTQGVFLGAAAIPNASFVTGLIFGVIVFTPPADAGESGRGGFGSLMDRIRGRLGNRKPAFAPSAAESPGAAPSARNPFADE